MRTATWVLGITAATGMWVKRCWQEKPSCCRAKTTGIGLGTGIYFWENSEQRPLDWAEYAYQHPEHFRRPVKQPFVVGAVMDLGNCLDSDYQLFPSEALEVVTLNPAKLSTCFSLSGLRTI